MFRSLLAATILLASPMTASALDSGYWVVGIEPQDQINPALHAKIRGR
jgi:hypothetical protein